MNNISALFASSDDRPLIKMRPWLSLVLLAAVHYRVAGRDYTGDVHDTDRIRSLPGLDRQPNFKQYSGYLQASHGVNLHYWLVESQGSPQEDPLILWLNGGPGCSSMEGLLTENGPFLVNEDGKTLRENPFGWNKVANVLFLESPAGVGYSYAEDSNIETDDDQTAKHNYEAILDFFNKFSEYKDRDFYVTGESYAGVYIPTLTMHLKEDERINLKGIAIGNGLLDAPLLQDSLYYYWYYHGLIGNELWGEMQSNCCHQGNCAFFPSTDEACQQSVAKATLATQMIPQNQYNLLDTCYEKGTSASRTGTRIAHALRFMKDKYADQEVVKQLTRMSVSDLESQGVPCVNQSAILTYMNQRRVQMALNIPLGVRPWTACNDGVSKVYKRIYGDMYRQFDAILADKKYRLLVYNGDMDMVCNFLGDQMFVDSLKQKEVVPHKAWYYTAADGTEQVAGYVRQYENLTFLTVKGAGHMVPTDKPAESLHMLKTFLANKEF